jgi:hypothetical protein
MDANRRDAVEIYRDWQCALARHGDTHVAAEFLSELAHAIETNPWCDVEGFQAVLERLHRVAFPDAATRPHRLSGGEDCDVLEDNGR